MPGDSASSKRGSYKRRRSSSGGKKAGYRFPRSINERVHRFKRNLALTTITGAGTTVLAGKSWQFSELPNYTEFTALFDQYKITHIKAKFMLVTDPGGVSPATAFVPRIWTVVDHNSDSAPSTINELRDSGTVRCRTLNPYRPVVVNLKPYVSTETYSSVAALMRKSPWINTTNVNPYHYGMKYAIETLPTNYKVEIECTVYFSTKNVV